MVGMDGLEWSVLRPLLQAGKCPNLASLMKRGSFGRLGTLSLTLSPVVWTTIATGKTPDRHRIGQLKWRNGSSPGLLVVPDARLEQKPVRERRRPVQQLIGERIEGAVIQGFVRRRRVGVQAGDRAAGEAGGAARLGDRQAQRAQNYAARHADTQDIR
jgi:hypothetical protein